MPPLAGSPAIDNGAATSFTTDQRGFPRVVGPGVDIGAVEFEASSIVTTDADSGPGSLRYALVYTTNDATITFDSGLSGTAILLTGGLITLNTNKTIDASALAQGIRIDAGANSPIFAVPQGMTASLKALTLTNGFSSDTNSGGAIRTGGTLTLNSCTLTHNSSGAANGGAIDNSGRLTLIDCTVANNAGNFAGAIQNTAFCTLEDCTFVANTCPGNGGAIDNDFSATLNLDQCTFTGNTSGGNGGSIDNYLSTVNLNNSIVAGSTAGSGSDIYNWGGSTVTTKGTNIVQSLANSGTVQGANEIIAVAPMLAALGNYGGRTFTMPPLSGSPAIDAGGIPDLATDQRGYPRISGRRVDIGAVEVQVAASPFELGSAAYTGSVSSGNAALQIAFTNAPGGSFTVFASTNLTQPLHTWQNLGAAAEIPLGSGHFQFIDTQAINYPQRFYKVRSP